MDKLSAEQRYYYDDPLAAAWMAKHHGFVFESTFVLDIEIAGGQAINEQNSWFAGKAYIHPDSLHLLEPQDNDDVKYIERHAVNIASQGFATYHWLQQDPSFQQGRLEVSIIQRNGLAFMWPKVEA